MKIKLSFTFLVAGAALILSLLFNGCAPSKPELRVYNWVDYFDEGLIEEFEDQYGCTVIMDYFDSNESMYAKIKAGATGYDVIFPTSYQAILMYEEGLIGEIDHSKIPNIGNIDPVYLETAAIDKELEYSVPYMIGTTGIGYSSTALPDLEESWAVLALPEVNNRSTLLNDVRETIGAALAYLGYSINSTSEAEIAEAAEVVIGWKRNIAKFENEQYKPGLASGEFILAHGYSGDVAQIVDENPEAAIEFMLPKEGFVVWCDDMVIPVDAPNVELAHTFINFMLEPEVAARNMEYNYYKAPNVPAYELVLDLLEDPMVFVPDELATKGEIIRPLGEVNAIYNKYWDQIKAAQ